MTRDLGKYGRRSLRLRGYDYTRLGGYFITICIRARENLLGQIVDGNLYLNDSGNIVRKSWDDLPLHYPHIQLDHFVAMPNHIHGIILIIGVGAGFKPAPTINSTSILPYHGLPEIVRAFKTFSSRRINEMRGGPGQPVWQRNYYEHVIRTELELNRLREYIATNPLRWQLDRENPQRTGTDEFDQWIYPKRKKR